MQLNMRLIASCFVENEPELSIAQLIERLAPSLKRQPRRARLIAFLSEIPSVMRSTNVSDPTAQDRFYERWPIKEAAEVEQADEERVEEKKAKEKLAKAQVTQHPAKIERVTLQLRLPGSLFMRLQQQALARGVSVLDLSVELFEKGLVS